MAKSFKKATEGAQDIYEQIARGGTQPTRDTENRQDTQDIRKKYYRFNLKMPMEYKDYLQEAAYRASSPTKTITITEYICNLIAADMERSNE